MRRIARKNPNTKQLWEDIYTGHIDQKKIRSDGDHLQNFFPLFDKAPRSYSKRTGKPTTAYFYVEKPETAT